VTGWHFARGEAAGLPVGDALVLGEERHPQRGAVGAQRRVEAVRRAADDSPEASQLWQTLQDLSGDLGLDGSRFDRLATTARDQIATLDRVHEYGRRRSFYTNQGS